MATFQDEILDEIEQVIKETMTQKGIPGLALALTDHKDLIHFSAHGYANVLTETPITADTLFPIGSLTKSFTALAILQQVDSGRIELTTPIDRYLPWLFTTKNTNINIHHLLCHTAGLPRGGCLPDSRSEVIELIETENLSPPGQHFHYSNIGYKLLGFILEDLLELNFSDIIQANILDPLGMSFSRPAITLDIYNQMASGYIPRYNDRPIHPASPIAHAQPMEFSTADGCIASTPEDIAAYIRMFLCHGMASNGRFVSERLFERMMNPAVELMKGFHYGYGLYVYHDQGRRQFEHGGGSPGYMAWMIGDLDDKIGVAVFANGPEIMFDYIAEPVVSIAKSSLKLARSHIRNYPATTSSASSRTPARDLSEYVGEYHSDHKRIRVLIEESNLLLEHQAIRTPMEPRGSDVFFVNHPDFNRFLIQFHRENKLVTEVYVGEDWYVGERYSGPTEFEYPSRWRGYGGFYRAHNPWIPNIRIFQRKGALILVYPSGKEDTLAQTGEDSFRIGDSPHSPERLVFTNFLDEVPYRVCAFGIDFERDAVQVRSA